MGEPIWAVEKVTIRPHALLRVPLARGRDRLDPASETGMGQVPPAGLASAALLAGRWDIIVLADMTPEALCEAIRWVGRQSPKPFGADISVDECARRHGSPEGVRLPCWAGNPPAVIGDAPQRGIRVMAGGEITPKARPVAEAGADAVIAARRDSNGGVGPADTFP